VYSIVEKVVAKLLTVFNWTVFRVYNFLHIPYSGTCRGDTQYCVSCG